ncbi:MAG: hypothetical protein QM831_08035 [Kofleriaceae bacterium]
MRNPELESEILKANHDAGAYTVYADWLLANGDARGELIVRAIQDRDPDAYLAEHREELLGRFATFDGTLELTWRNGFVKSATMGWEIFSGEDEDDTSASQLEAFLRLDVCALIDELNLGPTAHEDELMLDELAGAIDAVKPIGLTKLYLGDIDNWDISGTYSRLPHNDSLPAIREVTIHGGNLDLGAQIDLPLCQKFAVQSGQLAAGDLKTIAAAKLPAVEHLEIWFGDPNYGATGGVDDIAPLFQRTDFPKLTSLGLMNCAFADALVAHLADTPMLRQLRRLDLSMGNLSNAGIAAMGAKRDRFRHLEFMNLDDNALTEASREQATGLAAGVIFGPEQSPDRAVPRAEGQRYWRFVSVGE